MNTDDLIESKMLCRERNSADQRCVSHRRRHGCDFRQLFRIRKNATVAVPAGTSEIGGIRPEIRTHGRWRCVLFGCFSGLADVFAMSTILTPSARMRHCLGRILSPEGKKIFAAFPYGLAADVIAVPRHSPVLEATTSATRVRAILAWSA